MKIRLLLIAFAFAILGGCRTAPVMNVTEAPVVSANGKQLSTDQVRQAIPRAGRVLGWEMRDTGPGVVNAKIALRTHAATADVRYTEKTYSIVYRDSTNLDAKDGQIHSNYNGWVQNLDRGIRSELMSF